MVAIVVSSGDVVGVECSHTRIGRSISNFLFNALTFVISFSLRKSYKI